MKEKPTGTEAAVLDARMILITDIMLNPENPRTFIEDADFKDLVENIRIHGVLQPIILRSTPDGKKLFTILGGERRYRASKAAGRTDIPATIRTCSDEEAFEITIAENLHREDITPLDESKAYNAYKEKKGYNIKELAIHFSKPEEYIAKRLQLQKLIEEFQKMLAAGNLKLVHALQLARLAPEDQKQFYKDEQRHTGQGAFLLTDKDFKTKVDGFIMSLDAAPWGKDDATLVPAAGACNGCPFRTKNNASLFGDIKGERCMKRSCYDAKAVAHMHVQLQSAKQLEGIIFMFDEYEDYDKNLEQIAEQLRTEGFMVADRWDATKCNRKDAGARPMFILNGPLMGTHTWAKVNQSRVSSNSGTGKKKMADMKPEDQIKAKQERLERAEELDTEKVAALIIHAMKEPELYRRGDKGKAGKLNKVEEIAVRFVMLTKLHDHPLEVALFKKYKVDKVKDHFHTGAYHLALAINDEDYGRVCRSVFLDEFTGVTVKSANRLMLRAIANTHIKAKVDQFDKDQAAERKAREDRAATAIKSLREQRKVAEKAKKSAGRSKAAAKGKAPKKQAKNK